MRKSSGELFMVVVVIIAILMVSVIAVNFTGEGVEWVKDKFSGFISD